MKLSKGQKEELKLLTYFIKGSYSDADVLKYFERAEQGKHKEQAEKAGQPMQNVELNGFHALVWAKKSIKFNMELWEEGVLEGSVPYFTLLGGYEKTVYRKWYQFWKPKLWFEHQPVPRFLVEKMKGQMFKGIDAETIEKCYQIILSEKVK